MNVLFHDWKRVDGQTLFSISKDEGQYEQAVEDAREEGAVPQNGPFTVRIKDDSFLAALVERGTVFLGNRELGHIDFNWQLREGPVHESALPGVEIGSVRG